jgi:hypothetical protein
MATKNDGYLPLKGFIEANFNGVKIRNSVYLPNYVDTKNKANGTCSFAEGSGTTATGDFSHVGGFNSVSVGTNSFVYGANSRAEGNTTIVLGSNLTGSTANTVFVNRLNIKSVPAGTSVNNLGIDASGNVIIGSTGGNGGSSPISVVNSSSLFSTALPNTGLNASGVTNSIFMGGSAGNGATSASNSIFMGQIAGYQASGATYSIFLGHGAGFRATAAYNSIFFGQGAGTDATDANNSIFFGLNAGWGSTYSYNSNFFGYHAGQAAPNASYSNFLGYYAGDNASNASNSNFIGTSAGENAYGAYQSNFFGSNTGKEATNAFYSNFLGNSAGYQADTANDSNFLGQQAGYQATYALRSNFLGYGAGKNATNASYSNLFGYLVGKTFGSNNIGTNNIIIGTNISLPNAATNSINIGGVLFGIGTYSSTLTSPSISANTSGKIGIGIVTPTEKLHVSGNTLVEGNIIINSLKNAASLSTDSNGKIIVPPSDERLKHNITDLSDSLTKVNNLRGVSFEFNEEVNILGTKLGFIAQEVNNVIPELVNLLPNTEDMLTVDYIGMIPVLVEAIKELTKQNLELKARLDNANL